MKLTPWFDPWVKPKRKGVYRTSWFGDGYAWFDGKEWSNQNGSIEEASRNRRWNQGAAQEKAWRGLARAPK